jgi:hypothetical protein
MSNVALWQIIEDWLPLAGWEILRLRRPDANVNGDVLPAFIYCDKVAIDIKVSGPNNYYPQDKMCMIKDSEIVFFDTGHMKSLKATDPDFFSKLDQELMTLFKNAEWWQKKTGIVPMSKPFNKIWPK